jgi:hypothetical protein
VIGVAGAHGFEASRIGTVAKGEGAMFP